MLKFNFRHFGARGTLLLKNFTITHRCVQVRTEKVVINKDYKVWYLSNLDTKVIDSIQSNVLRQSTIIIKFDHVLSEKI